MGKISPTSQTAIILEHLKNNSRGITSFESFSKYGITRLSAKIFELREKGYNVKDFYEESQNRYGRNVRYKRYYLENI